MSTSNKSPLYLEYLEQFKTSPPLENSKITNSTALFTIFLLLLAFGSLSIALLGDIKKKNFITFLLNSIVASISVGYMVARAQQDEYALDSNIYELTARNFDKVIHGTNHTSIVKFYAPWCGYCQQLKPIWTKLGKALGSPSSKLNYNIASVNCDKDVNKQLCAQYQIRGFPTVMVFRPPKYDKSKVNSKRSRHASEVYNGERNVKAITNFLNSRLKNYVKKLHNFEDDLSNWLNEEKEQGKILLVSSSNQISPLLKSIAIDFLSKLNFAAIGKLNKETINVTNSTTKIPASEKSTLIYFDPSKDEIEIYTETDKLNDKIKIEEWILKVSGIKPVEGVLSEKGKKLAKYRLPSTNKSKKSTKKTKVDHDEL
ncbi:uncharacterized protein KGF55_005778 [Candida pseudojiufengensis]|uniref:uncharacterized protein n=1 Tax=Candida pseudojiufengensis TaxID=497109 RepID=UPI0022249EB4|nr:uncharacterized protein KGF55_005778 [Candida pseudojiufengensis]KAI5958518.1 hypothetical protein KGF55_005778 [Candida pseudojiufengensis]